MAWADEAPHHPQHDNRADEVATPYHARASGPPASSSALKSAAAKAATSVQCPKRTIGSHTWVLAGRAVVLMVAAHLSSPALRAIRVSMLSRITFDLNQAGHFRMI